MPDRDRGGADDGCGREQRVGFAAHGQHPHGRDCEEHVGEDVPDSGRGASDRHLLHRKPQRRNMEYESAMPTASPPGSTLAAAVEA